MEEITQYVNEESIRGDLARELVGVISDYQMGTINAQDKEQLVNAILASYQAQGLAEDEVMWRWAISAVTIAASVV